MEPGKTIELGDAEQLDLPVELAAFLEEGVLSQRDQRGVVDLFEGPTWLPGPVGRPLVASTFGHVGEPVFVRSHSAEFIAHGPARVVLYPVDEVDPLGVLGQRVRALEDQVLRQLEPFQDFLDPKDGRVPRGRYETTALDMVVLVVEAEADQLELAAARGLTPLSGRALLTFSGWKDFGAHGRTTRYDEAARFLPCREGLLFCDRIHPDSAAAVVLGRELFGFPKTLGITRLGRHAAWSVVDDEIWQLARWTDGGVVELDVFGAEFLRALLAAEGPLDVLLAGLTRVMDAVPLSTLSSWLKPPVQVRMAFPSGGTSMEFRDPRRVERLDVVSPEVHAGWRLVLDASIDGGSGSGAPTRQTRPAPMLVRPQHEALGDPLVRALGQDATVAKLQHGEGVEVAPEQVAFVLSGELLRSQLVRDGVRYIGHTGGHGEALFGLGLDRWMWLEAHGEASVLLAPEDALQGVPTELLRGPLLRAEERVTEDLARLEMARESQADDRAFLVQAFEDIDRALPPELEPRNGPGLLLVRVPFDLRHRVIVEARELLPHELDPTPLVGVNHTDFAAVLLPCGQGDTWYVSAAWALDVHTLLETRAAGWPSRLGQLGPGGVTIISDGVPVVSEPPPAPEDLGGVALGEEFDVRPTVVPVFTSATLLAPGPEGLRTLRFARREATLGFALEHGLPSGEPLPILRTAPLRLYGRAAIDQGTSIYLEG